MPSNLVINRGASSVKGTLSLDVPCMLRERTDVFMRLFFVSCILLHIAYLDGALARPSMTGQVVTNIGDVGAHYPLFLVEKSHHPENITVVYTKLDQHCHVIPEREHDFMPTLDFHWLMDETR